MTDRYQPPTCPATPPIVYCVLSNWIGDPASPADFPDTLGPYGDMDADCVVAAVAPFATSKQFILSGTALAPVPSCLAPIVKPCTLDVGGDASVV